MLTIITFILVLGILVLVHELGHFLAAKKAGCDVEEFAIGFPPRLFSIKKGATKYSINLLPLGGYVKILGEDGGHLEDPDAFGNKPFGWRVLIISAGVLMNVFLAYILITIGLVAGVPTMLGEDKEFGKFARLDDRQVQIISVLENTPADRVGLLANDVVLSVEGQEISQVDRLQAELSREPAEEIEIRVKRGGESLSFAVTPERIKEIEKTGIGVGLSDTATLSYPWYVAWLHGGQRTVQLLWLIITAFATLIAGLFSGAGVGAEIAGPIGIAVITGQIAQLGIIHLLQFTAVLSLNLAIINILPFPALDGSRLLFIIIEKLRRRKINITVERWVHIVGFGLLMLLMVAITIKDVGTYGSSIWESIKSIF